MAKLLLVEDDKSLREIYGVRLLAEGYDIVSAGDGEEALAMAIKEKPQLIISDVMMPKISGFDMLDILRSTTETRDIKVIMMTALSSDDQRSRGEQLGADKYLVKSQVGIEDVVRTVHEVLGDSAGGAAAPADKPAEAPVADTKADDKPAEASAPAAPAASAAPAPAADGAVKPADDASVTPASDDSTVASGSAPGNDEAGPLPPQPTEVAPEEPKIEAPAPVESSLPQPTAPFSSPRPATLGENIVNPTTDTAETPAPVSTEESEQLHNELQATSEPITTQVDAPEAPLDDADTTPSIQPPVGETLPTTPDLSAPTVDPTAPAEENKDNSAGPVSSSTPLS